MDEGWDDNLSDMGIESSEESDGPAAGVNGGGVPVKIEGVGKETVTAAGGKISQVDAEVVNGGNQNGAVDDGHGSTLKHFMDEVLRLNEEAERREEELEQCRLKVGRLQMLEQEVQSLGSHAKEADEWMAAANANMERLNEEKSRLEEVLKDRDDEISNLKMNIENMERERKEREIEIEKEKERVRESDSKDKETNDDNAVVEDGDASGGDGKLTYSEVLRKLAISEQQRAQILVELAGEKERNIANLMELREEVKSHLSRS